MQTSLEMLYPEDRDRTRPLEFDRGALAVNVISALLAVAEAILEQTNEMTGGADR